MMIVVKNYYEFITNIMSRAFKSIVFITNLMLAACGGNRDYDELNTDVTVCHPKYHKKAYNKSYEIKGIKYYPQKHYEYSAVGMASYYGGGDVFHGRKTSNGEIFDMNLLSAAHKTIPIPSVVLVTNMQNGRALKLKVNDRGPFIDGRIIDVSRKAARMLGFEHKGVVEVKVETLVPESLVLADDMANGLHQSSVFYAPEVMLAESEPKKRTAKKPNRSSTHNAAAMHLAQQIIIPTENNPQAINVENNHMQMHMHPTIFSKQKLPNIKLTADKNNVNSMRKREDSPKQKNQSINSTRYYVQSGPFTRFTNAQKLIALLSQRKPEAKIKMQPIQINDQQLFQVILGPFMNKTQAHSHINELKVFDKRSSIIVH